jgi:assimilatory nitrate reductase catalytic subunit
MTRGRDLDITGLSYEILDTRGPQHWPFPAGAECGKQRLYEDGVFPTPSGRARFFAERHKPVAEPVSARYPLSLTTGRLRDHWHGLSRTGSVATLFGHVSEPRLGMNGNDMARRGIRAGELVRVESRRGALHVIAESDDAIRSGQVYLPMHWGKRFLGGSQSAGTNTITSPAFDPISRQPELKHAAVKVTAAALPWRLVAFAELDAVRALDALQALQSEVAFASAVLIGRKREGVLFRAAHDLAPPAEWLAALDQLLGLDGDDVLRYEDARRGHSRRVRISDELLRGVRLSGDAGAVTSAEWLREWLVGGQSIERIRRLLLLPASQAPAGFMPAGRVLCQCFGVSERDIVSELARTEGEPAQRLRTVQSRMHCGTNCGSCVPELKALAEKCAAEAGRLVA